MKISFKRGEESKINGRRRTIRWKIYIIIFSYVVFLFNIFWVNKMSERQKKGESEKKKKKMEKFTRSRLINAHLNIKFN